VISLIKSMQKELLKEQKEDEDMHAKVVCWCKKNGPAKDGAISEAQADIERLTARITELAGTIARLAEEIAALKKEIEEHKQALKEATAIRKKEMEAFKKYEEEMLVAIDQLGRAIDKLKKHNQQDEAAGAFLQVSSEQAQALRAAEAVARSNLVLLALAERNPLKLQRVTAMLQQPEKTEGEFGMPKTEKAKDFYDAAPIGSKSYNNRSGRIFGILIDMLDTFKADLEKAQKQEMAAQKAYEEFKAAKEEAIKAAEELKEQKKTEKATAEEQKAAAEQELADTQATMAADQKFLMNLREHCENTGKNYDDRVATRQKEIEGVNKALEILTSDATMGLFFKGPQNQSDEERKKGQLAAADQTNSLNAAVSRDGSKSSDVKFLQISRESHARAQAAAVLRKLGLPELSLLASKVELDAFTKVKKAIAELVEELLRQQEDESNHKDFCVKNLNRNEQERQDTRQEIDDTQTEIDFYTKEIEEKEAKVAQLEEEVATSISELKRAGEDRVAASNEYQTVLQQHNDMIEILNKVTQVLKQSLNTGDGERSSLVQQNPVLNAKGADELEGQDKTPDSRPPPPSSFKKKTHSGSGVLTLMKNMVEQLQAAMATFVKDEQESRAAYEEFAGDTTEEVNAKRTEAAQLSASIANDKNKRAGETDDNTAAKKTMKQLQKEDNDLHKACDFVLKNFDVRQKARQEEIDALNQATKILSGANFKGTQVCSMRMWVDASNKEVDRCPVDPAKDIFTTYDTSKADFDCNTKGAGAVNEKCTTDICCRNMNAGEKQAVQQTLDYRKF
jgi:hypothetical protein